MLGYTYLNIATLGRIIANSLLEITAFCPNRQKRIFQLLQGTKGNTDTWVLTVLVSMEP